MISVLPNIIMIKWVLHLTRDNVTALHSCWTIIIVWLKLADLKVIIVHIYLFY